MLISIKVNTKTIQFSFRYSHMISTALVSFNDITRLKFIKFNQQFSCPTSIGGINANLNSFLSVILSR
jgi:hypothetical protein